MGRKKQSSGSSSARWVRGKVTPNLDHSRTPMLNLTVLQRIDPFIEEIMITVSHVANYSFDVELSKWSRRDFEGTLFVVRRSIHPQYQLIVLNRLNIGLLTDLQIILIFTHIHWGQGGENLVEDLLEGFEFEVRLPYMIYRKPSQEVHGIWFYDQDECQELINLFCRILGEDARYEPKPKSEDTSSNSKSEEVQATATSSEVSQGPSEPSSTPTVATAQSDDSFIKFINQLGLRLSTGPSSSYDSDSGPTYPNKPPLHPNKPPLHPSSSVTASSSLPTQQLPSLPLSSSSVPPTLDLGSNQRDSSTLTANLVPPSAFNTPSSPRVVYTLPMAYETTTPVHPLPNLQPDYGRPVLQPFPPPVQPLLPPQGLTHTTFYGFLTKEKVQAALLLLVQDYHFMDMVYQAILKVHHQ